MKKKLLKVVHVISRVLLAIPKTIAKKKWKGFLTPGAQQ